MGTQSQIRSFVLLLLSSALVLVAGCRNSKDDPKSYDIQGTLAPIAEETIIPAHQIFLNETEALKEECIDFLSRQDLEALTDLQNQLLITQQKWSACEAFEFGEAADLYIHSRIGKWPTNPFLIEQWASGNDSITRDFIESRGASSRGLPAIEYLLFDKPLDSTLAQMTIASAAAQRRAYLFGLCENLQLKADLLHEFWAPGGSNYGGRWANSSETGLDHPMSLLINRTIGLLEEVAKKKIGTPLGKFDWEVAQPDMVEAGLSSNSLELAIMNCNSLFQIHTGVRSGGGISAALDALEAKFDGESLSTFIDERFQLVLESLDRIDTPLKEAVIGEYEKVDLAYSRLRDLLTLYKADLASALSVTVTVSDNDGD